MKLAFCLFKYFPYGGLQRDFLRIAKRCATRGHEVHVYTMQWDGPPEPWLHLHLLKTQGWQNHTVSENFAKQLKKELAINAYDLVIGFNKMPYLDWYYAADICYLARVEQRGFLYHLLPRFKQLASFERAVFAKDLTTQIMLISALQQPEFERFYHTEPKRFHLLPPGIAKDRMAPSNAAELRKKMRESLQLNEKQLLILMVGSGFKAKGVDRAIIALAALPEDIRKRSLLYILGQDNAESFVALAKKLDIFSQVHFMGGRKDVPEFLLAADLFLHPAYHENTGTVLLEALVSGLPVLTTAICGYAHYIKTANAGIVLDSPFQQENLNATLVHMLKAVPGTWQQNALVFSKKTDLYSMPDKAADLIESSLAEKSRTFPLNFQQAMHLTGEKFRHQEGRLTQRICLDDKYYFLKLHRGVGYKEVFKNIFQGRLPVISAKNEWLALKKLPTLGIDVPKAIAYEKQGFNPAYCQSYVLMEELAPIISLEDFCRSWQSTKPKFSLKQLLLTKVANIARTLHQNGINHRDFYLCHFLLDATQSLEQTSIEKLKLYLIDLHRAQLRTKTPKRWKIKDLAGLFFSAKSIGLTRRDFYRFMKIYEQRSLREIFQEAMPFWQLVKKRGEQIS